MAKAFRVLKDSKLEPRAKAGTTIYECVYCDYGIASDDTRAFRIEHRSFTLDPAGGYPFFTMLLRDVEPRPSATHDPPHPLHAESGEMTKRWSSTASGDGKTKREASKAVRREGTRITCAVCDGTGMRPFENGPEGATWTDYERCHVCKGAGEFWRS